MNEFNNEKNTKENKIKQKYVNRLKDLKTVQHYQMNEYEGSGKYHAIKTDKHIKNSGKDSNSKLIF